MNIKLGGLEIIPVGEHLDMVTPSVAETLASAGIIEKVGVTDIDPGLSDTAAFCAHYGVGMEQSANCVILAATRGERTWFAACVILGSTRADINGLARRTLDARKISFAPMEQAVSASGMEYGAITPIGLPSDWPILVDKAVTETGYVILGSGLRKSKLIVPESVFAHIPNVQIVEGLGRVAESR